MPWADDGYSRLISWLKILFPVAALGLLSTVFLLSESNEASLEIPFSNIEVNDEGLVERIVEPSFAGATERGDLISFVAESARPEGEGMGRIAATDFRGRLDLNDGSNVTFRSDQALVDQPGGTARLEGNAVIVSSIGYTAETQALTAYLDNTRLESDSQIIGKGPLGQFTAGRMIMTQSKEGSDLQLLFTDGVKLIYRPSSD